MGFRHAVVLSSTSFLLGVLFVSFNVDYRMLYLTPTPEAIESGFQYYTTFHNAPVAVKALLHGFIGIGILGLIAKLCTWDESAMFFDGSSLVGFMFAVILYLSVTIPGLRTIVDPLPDETETDRIETLKVVGAGNTLAIIALVAVLAMQAGQEYARRLDEKAQAAEAAKATQTKKDN